MHRAALLVLPPILAWLPFLLWCWPTAAQVISAPFVAGNGTARGPITAPDFRIAAHDVAIYVDPAGSDSNPGTAAAPLKTLTAAVRALPAWWRGKTRIYLAAGSYTISSATYLRIGTALVDGYPLAIVGTMADSGLGERTISSVTSDGGYVYQVTDNTLAPTLDQYVGSFLRLTSGAASGLRVMIRGNSTGGMFEFNATDMGAHPAPGDKFVVEAPASIINYSSALHFSAAGGASQGFHVVLYGIRLTNTGTSATVLYLDQGLQMMIVACQLSLGAGRLQMNPGSYLSPARTTGVADDVTATGDVQAGLYVTGSGTTSYIIPGSGSLIQGFFVFRGAGMVTSSQSGVEINLLNLDASGAVFDLEGLTNLYMVGSSHLKGRIRAAGYGVELDRGAMAHTIANMEISDNTYDGIYLRKGAQATVTSVTGTGNGGVGVHVDYGSIYIEGDANVTITGTGGDIKVNATTTTHAAILGGTPLTDPVGGMATK